MLEIALALSVPACLFALAGAYAVHRAWDLGCRWVAHRDRTKEAQDAVVVCHRAIEKFAEAVRELESRTRELEEANNTEGVAARFRGRRAPGVPIRE